MFSTFPHTLLKIEENTPFFKLQDKLNLPDEDDVCSTYIFTVEKLKELGFEQYEISNFAKKSYESRHNCKYWRLVPYLGIGACAHSMWGGKRFHYNESFEIIDDGEVETGEERIMLGLRLKKGIKKDLINKDLTKYINAGFMEENEGFVSFTPHGCLVSNTIIADILYD